jgi:hypothetical protein
MTHTDTAAHAPGTLPRPARLITRLLVPAAIAMALVVAACAPPTGGGTTTPTTPTTTTSSTTSTTVPPTYRAGRCIGTEGITIVVDFVGFENKVTVRCALGAQASGFTTLADAGFVTHPGRYPGTVCQLNGLPTQGHPYCWTTGGYWSYWKATSAGAPWTYSEWGAGNGPSPAPGAVEGWRFAPFAQGPAVPPRVGTSGPIVP